MKKYFKLGLFIVLVAMFVAIVPHFTMSAIESMSSHRIEDGVETTITPTTNPYDYATIDDMCKRYLGNGYTNDEYGKYCGTGSCTGYYVIYDPAVSNRAALYINGEYQRSFIIGG